MARHRELNHEHMITIPAYMAVHITSNHGGYYGVECAVCGRSGWSGRLEHAPDCAVESQRPKPVKFSDIEVGATFFIKIDNTPNVECIKLDDKHIKLRRPYSEWTESVMHCDTDDCYLQSLP